MQRLAELCQCDVRFSINTLQFVSIIAKKEKRYVSVNDIQKVTDELLFSFVLIFFSVTYGY